MKKFIAFLLVLVILCCCLTACENTDDNDSEDNVSSSIDTSQKDESKNETDSSDKKDDNEFKVTDTIYNENSSGIMGAAYLSLPKISTMYRGAGQVAPQGDDTLILLGGQHLETKISVNKVEEVFNEFIDQPIDVLNKYRRIDFRDHAFNIETSDIVTINDYTMCKHTGTHTYTHDGVAGEMNFVAYITQLKSNGAYVYWIVIDESDDQSQFEKIDEYATKIAKSLHE